MTGLRGMIRNELARRDESGAKWPAFSFVVDDKHPAALADVAAAVKAVVAGADDRAAGQGDRVRITSAVYEAVVDALRAHSPRRDIVVRTIEESGLRFAPRPEPAEGAGPSSPAAHIDEPDRADAAERAAARLARMRGLI